MKTLLRFVALATFGAAILLTPRAEAQVDARMLRYPDVSGQHIAFVYGGDVWVMDKSGGDARRLSSPAGEESYPRFSPQGDRIAFSGNYDGNVDIYVVPTSGGDVRRVTYHPGVDRMVDWTPDGRLLFASSRSSGVNRYNQLWTVSAEGGLATRLPVPYGEFASMSDDGEWLAYTPKDRSARNWKRYRGGMAPDIWLFNLQTLESRNISDSDANEMQPMFRGQTIYFAADRGPMQRLNVWAYDITSGDMRQITRFEDYDISHAALGPDDIVFQAGGQLHLLDLESEETRLVDVRLVTDRSTLKPRRVDASGNIANVGISPSGSRALFEARGEIFTVPAENGVTRNLTRTSGAAERFPAWSPDGRWIAYWSDRDFEYELMLQPAAGGPERVLTSLGEGYRYLPMWSPDSSRIAFVDNVGTLRVLDIESRQLTVVDRIGYLLHPQLAGFEVQWSSDSRWLAYSRALETQLSAVFLYDTRDGALHQATSGYTSDSAPVFDPDGKYLYYLSNRSLQAVYSDFDATWVYPNSTRIVAAPLRADVPSPLAPRNDEETPAPDPAAADATDDVAAAAPAADSDADDPTDADEGLSIDLEGLERRAVVLPPQAGNYSQLRAVSGSVIYRRQPRTGAGGGPSAIVAWQLEAREEATLVDNAGGFEISADGKKMIVGARGNFYIVQPRPGQQLREALATDGLQMSLEPLAEWRQIFNDVWRAYRDFFYDPNLHGLDWEAMRELYGTLVEDAVTRWDLNFVIGELIGEVNASHTVVGGGDLESSPRRPVGLLGVDWSIDDGGLRIARIVEGAPWDLETRSPLRAPGISVAVGDYVLAVNGIPVDVNESPYAAFEGLAGETVALTVNDRASQDGAREVLVETLSSEARLRHLEWIESNRRRVDEASGGRIGYVFVPNTAVSGQTELVRQLTSQVRKEGLIIDERFNAGGQLPDRFIEKFNRQLVNRIYFRSGDIVDQPNVGLFRAKAMLINGWAGSGGDAFPYFFKTLEVGPILGERTWGGLIGPAVPHQTIDGGRYTAPPGRIYGPDGEWFAEGHGVEPDILVVDDPSELARGVDPQLERAIAEVLRLLDATPATTPGRPAFERRTSGQRPPQP